MAIITLKKISDRYSQLVVDGIEIPSVAITVCGYSDSTINTEFVRSRIEAANKFLRDRRKEREDGI